MAKKFYEQEMEKFLHRELEPRLAECRSRTAAGEGAPAINAMGLLYARYGLRREAEAEFRNVLFIRQAYYRRLKALDPEPAGRYAYIALRGSSGERATPTSGLDPKVIWEDE